jgi:MFS family permease
MDANLKRVQRNAIFVGFLFAFLQQGKIFIQSSLSVIAEAFPEQSITSIQTLISGTALPLLIGAFSAGPLTTRLFSKKSLSIMAMIFITIGGVGPLFFQDNFQMIMTMRLVLGFGLGLLSPTKSAVIADYTSGLQRNRILGLAESVVTVCGVLINLIGGYLALISWKASFYMYLVVVPILIATIFLLPNKKPDGLVLEDNIEVKTKEKEEKVEVSQKKGKFELNPQLVAIYAFGFLFMLFFNSFGLNIAMHVKNSGLGDPSMAGILGSSLSVGGIAAGLSLGFVFKRLKSSTLGFGSLCLAVGFGILAVAPSIPIAMFGCFMCGFGLNTCVAQGTFLCTTAAPSTHFVLATGLYVGFIHVAQFLTPYVLNPIAQSLSVVVGLNRFATVYLIVSIATLVIGIAYIFILKKIYNKSDFQKTVAH